ncbi:hypothetical protein DPEC_G00247030 [Dallia pectoralis]|uniref:Uncharacterized protein n=1 Tax=Dallia pectoralis TaxID=75939 RepID=A0ACC2FW83_DALPE|nr:hypothetical protein DPEC_G00247030 [Dallia pectoralis]
MGCVVRQKYCVQGPQFLQHIDTNHRLIRHQPEGGRAGQRQRTETDINTTSRQRKDLTNPTYTRSERTTGQYLSDHKVGGSQVDLPALRVSFLYPHRTPPSEP